MMHKLTKKGKSQVEIPDIAAHAHELLKKEKLEGQLECSIQAEDNETPLLPWAKRFFRVSMGSLQCFELVDINHPVYQIDVQELEGISQTPFQVAFSRNDRLHILAIETDHDTMSQWVKTLDTLRQLYSLSSLDAFERKSAQPKNTFAKSPSFDKLSKILANSKIQAEPKEDLPPPLTPLQQGIKEFEILKSKIQDDPPGELWAAFVGELLELKPICEDLKEILGEECHSDIFSNFEQVFQKSYDLLKIYISAKSDPSQFGNSLKDASKDLEEFSAFCANVESAKQILESKPKSLQDPGHLALIGRIISKPTETIKQFSVALKKYSNEGFFPSAEFDESGAILEDVLENIRDVMEMFEDWRDSTKNEFRKNFLTPAKRNLVYVDSTLDNPAMLFSDVLVFFEFVDDSDLRNVFEILPLSFVEIEEKGKFTTFKCSILDREAKVKSQNNRSANVLRRKVLEAKELLAEKISVGLRKLHTLPTDFPTVNFTITHKKRLLLGTDSGLHMITKEGEIKKILNVNERISKLEISEALQLIIFSVQEKDKPDMKIMTYPLLALDSFPAIQKHVYPELVKEGVDCQLYSTFESLGSSQCAYFAQGSMLSAYDLTQGGEVVLKKSHDLEDHPTFLKYMSNLTWCATTKGFYKFGSKSELEVVYSKKEQLPPIDCLEIDGNLLFCFSEHGWFFDQKNDAVEKTLVWMDTACSFAFLDPYLLIFTKNFIEVREKSRLWCTKQLLPTPNISVLNPLEHMVFLNGQISQIQIIPS